MPWPDSTGTTYALHSRKLERVRRTVKRLLKDKVDGKVGDIAPAEEELSVSVVNGAKLPVVDMVPVIDGIRAN